MPCKYMLQIDNYIKHKLYKQYLQPDVVLSVRFKIYIFPFYFVHNIYTSLYMYTSDNNVVLSLTSYLFKM